MSRRARHRSAARLAFAATAFLAAPVYGGSVEACLSASEQGERLKNESRLLAARDRLAACAAEDCPTPVRRMCHALIEEIDAATPALILSARDPSNRVLDDIHVSVDGRAASRSSEGSIRVDPGAHVVHVTHRGMTQERTLEIGTGQRVPLVFVFEPAPQASSGPPPRAASAREGSPIGAYVAGGIGLAGLVGSGVFALKWMSDGSCSPACNRAEVDRAQTDAVVTDVLLGASLVAIGVSIWLLVRGDSEGLGARAAARTP